MTEKGAPETSEEIFEKITGAEVDDSQKEISEETEDQEQEELAEETSEEEAEAEADGHVGIVVEIFLGIETDLLPVLVIVPVLDLVVEIGLVSRGLADRRVTSFKRIPHQPVGQFGTLKGFFDRRIALCFLAGAGFFERPDDLPELERAALSDAASVSRRVPRGMSFLTGPLRI